MGFTRREFFVLGGVGLTAACSSSTDETPLAETQADDQAPPESTTPVDSEPTPETVPQTTVPPLVDAPPFTGEPPFGLGVASGDPDATSVVLWSRLVNPDGQTLSAAEHQVAIDVATDAEFTTIVLSEIVTTTADHGHSIHFVADGLSENSWYWYRFRAGESTSTIGRTRTTPAAELTTDTPLRLGFASCQHWESGTYAAHRHLVDAELDLFVWLGDYMYEGGPRPQGVTTANGERVHSGPEVETLEGYRSRYAQYKSDPHLQAHHAARPWIVTWDDHEVDNNYANLITEDGQSEDDFLARRTAAHQAWWEHMPVRLAAPASGSDFPIYRTIDWGTLASIHMLDGRQYRDDQPVDGEPIEIGGLGGLGVHRLGPTALDPAHSMLGSVQRQWLEGAVAESEATWTVLGNQVFMHGLNILPGTTPATNTDTWDGYFGERQELLSNLASSADNLVVLSGDFHASSTAELRVDPFDLDLPVVGTEFMAPAISSIFPPNLTPLAPAVLGFNPQVTHFETRNGYMTCEVTLDSWTTTLYSLDDVTAESSPIAETAQFTVRAGVPGVSEFTVS